MGLKTERELARKIQEKRERENKKIRHMSKIVTKSRGGELDPVTVQAEGQAV
jgi:hypothetical protein